jgi:hypothetical protein
MTFHTNFSHVVHGGCSSANTLRIERLELGCEQLTKGPDVIRQPCRHCWRALPPAETNRAVACALVPRQLLPQAHGRSYPIVEAWRERSRSHTAFGYNEGTRAWGTVGPSLWVFA